jgi:PAS domain S-box-containing protein
MVHRLADSFFQGAIEGSLDSICVLDLEGRILFLNGAGVAAFEIEDFEALAGRAWTALWQGPASTQIEAGLAAALRGETRRFEGVFATAGGAEKCWDVFMTPVRGATGEMAGVIATSHDITHRKSAERELAEALERSARSESRLKLALTLADVHVWELDYVRRELNKAGAEDTFFTTPKTYEDLFRDVYATVDPRDRPRVEAAWRRHEADGSPFRPEYRLVRGDDREVWVQGALEFFKDAEGRPQRLVGAVQNITERKSAEQALRRKDEAEAAIKAKSDLLASMSHELRTPLNAILGFSEVMKLNQKREPLTAQQHKAVSHIIASGHHLLTMIQAMLDLAHLDSGSSKFAIQGLPLDDLLDEVARNFAPQAQGAGLTLVCEPGEGPPRRVAADHARLCQVLSSLVSNAIKYNRPGGEIRVVARALDDRVEIAVSDTGVGVPAARLPDIFQPFNRLGREGGAILGAGVGLAISKRLVEAMGGDLRVDSVEGEGSIFTVTLFAAAATAPGAPIEIANDEAA